MFWIRLLRPHENLEINSQEQKLQISIMKYFNAKL